MEIVSFDKYKKFNRRVKYFFKEYFDEKFYEDIVIDNCVWKLKYGPFFKYECYSEYIGSHILDILGVPVHNTIMGTYQYNDVILPVVACKDVTLDRFLNFDEISDLTARDLNDRKFLLSDNELEKALFIIEHQNLIDVQQFKQRFLQMVFADIFISNPDRHWNNFGAFVSDNHHAWLSPLFDNGDCLYSMKISHNVNFINEVLEKINSNKYLPGQSFYGMENILYRLSVLNDDTFKATLLWIIDVIQEKKSLIEDMVDDISLISDSDRLFYKTLLLANYKFLCSLERKIPNGLRFVGNQVVWR